MVFTIGVEINGLVLSPSENDNFSVAELTSFAKTKQVEIPSSASFPLGVAAYLRRSLRHLVELVETLSAQKIGLKSLNDPVDTTHAQGRLIFNLFASLAEFERDLIRERTNAGLSAARARGRVGGRPKGLDAQAEATAMAAETLYREGRLSMNAIADKLHISKSRCWQHGLKNTVSN